MTDHAELIAELLAEVRSDGDVLAGPSDLDRRAADALSSLVSERDELRGEVYVPGEFCCAKCGFMLSQFTISANTGAIGSRDHPGERCPNDGAPLWRVTWKQRAEQHYERAAEEMSRATAAEANAARMRALVEQAFRDGIVYGNNVSNADPDIAWQHSRARASLSNTSEGGERE